MILYLGRGRPLQQLIILLKKVALIQLWNYAKLFFHNQNIEVLVSEKKQSNERNVDPSPNAMKVDRKISESSWLKVRNFAKYSRIGLYNDLRTDLILLSRSDPSQTYSKYSK